jgi:type VI secretion system protein VasI
MGSIEYKIDDGNIYKENWIKSDNLKRFFSPKPIDLIKNLMSANKISFRVQKYKVDAFLEASFNLDGLSQAIVPVQEACDWK